MKKVFKIGMVVLALAVISSAADAADVVVIKRGKKYHLPTCPLVQDKKTTVIDEHQAVLRAMHPCSKCFKTRDGDAATEEQK